MRGRTSSQVSVVCLLNLEDAIPATHPIRKIKRLADEVLHGLDGVFSKMYADRGRPSIPPERLLLASVLMALYSVRSERMLCERLRYDLLFRWFLDMDLEQEPFDPTSFCKNRERLIEHDVAKAFFAGVVERARLDGLVSSDHFSVDGTLIEAWGLTEELPAQGPADPERQQWMGRFPRQEAQQRDARIDNGPGSRLWRKGKGREAKLCLMGHSLMENRSGLLLDMRVTVASGHSERDAALEMVDALGLRDATLGADRGYDTRDFVDGCRSRGITPHVAQHTSKRRSAVDRRTTRWPGYAISLIKRRLIEQGFGWAKSVGGLRRSRLRGVRKTQLLAHVVGAAYNLLRLVRLIPQPS